jgi:cholest-4-en-3-one 26-monooxygenase
VHAVIEHRLQPGQRVQVRLELRRTAPVWWNAQRRGSAGFADDGYWAVTRHADIMEVSRRSDLFSSWENTALIRFDEGIDRDAIEMQRVILLNIDPPEHTSVRRIVSRGFTPRAVAGMRDNLRGRAESIVATALAAGTGDFVTDVTDVACELPLQAIAELIGIPQEDRKKIFQWSNAMIGYDDPEFRGDGTVAAMELLTVAGNETTRNAISHGMLAFFDHPDQWALFKAERPPTAADEIIRWGTPVTVFQRTAVADTELGGQRIKAGQRLGLFYLSGNFDEDVFDRPQRFDIRREPNPHLGLGGFGAHYCLGASLAKLEIGLIFNAIADAMPDIRLAGEPERLRSGWLNGIKRLPVSYAGSLSVSRRPGCGNIPAR